MPDATRGGTNAHASAPLGAPVIVVGAVWIAWIMPSFEPNSTRLRRSRCAVW
jgi:hypothetical protein